MIEQSSSDDYHSQLSLLRYCLLEEMDNNYDKHGTKNLLML